MRELVLSLKSSGRKKTMGLVTFPFFLFILGGCVGESTTPPKEQGNPTHDAAQKTDRGQMDKGGKIDTLTAADAPKDSYLGDQRLLDGAIAPPPDMVFMNTENGCPALHPKPSLEPWTMRHPAAGFGGIVSQSQGGHNDVFLKSPTDYIRVGARLDWGGTVVFFGLSGNPQSNVIDANDTGRELQIALYDPTRSQQGCAYNASCLNGLICETSITFLGWNPVQGGDECGHGAKVLSHGQVGDALQLVVQPNQWNPDWEAVDCRKSSCGATGLPVNVTYTYELRFVREHVVEVMSQVTSQETISHPSTGQEFPTLYVSYGSGGPDLPLLLDSSGATVGINTTGNDGFYYDNFSSPRPWVTWQDVGKTYGVGLAMDEGITNFQGWRGDGNTAPYFHNVRAQISFGLPAGGMVRGISYLALGDYGTVKFELEAVLAQRPPFGWVDEPASLNHTYAPGGAVPISGWVLDTTAISQVQLEVDGAVVSTLPVNKSRSDVCNIYPAYQGCPNVGFDGALSTTGWDGCGHLLRILATDPDGNTSVLAERGLWPN